MAKTVPRLHAEERLFAGAEVKVSGPQAHYLGSVLRIAPGDPVKLFNGRDGEFLSYVLSVGKKQVDVKLERLLADAKPPPDIDYCFAPLKHQRLDYLVQKAVELGARRLRPVITQRTIAERVNLERMRANVIEASEQCNLVHVPEVVEPASFATVLRDWDERRSIVFGDETAAVSNPLAALKSVTLPVAIFVGPEGGFSDEERKMLHSIPVTMAISLGPRIMRADTAAVAILALVQAVLGDWG